MACLQVKAKASSKLESHDAKGILTLCCDFFDVISSTIWAVRGLFDTCQGVHYFVHSHAGSIQRGSLLIDAVLKDLIAGCSINQHMEMFSATCKITYFPLFASKVNLDSMLSLLPDKVKNPALSESIGKGFDKGLVSVSCKDWLESAMELIKRELSLSFTSISSLDDLCNIRSQFNRYIESRKSLDYHKVCHYNPLINPCIYIYLDFRISWPEIRV